MYYRHRFNKIIEYILMLFFVLITLEGVIRVINENTINIFYINFWKEILFVFIILLYFINFIFLKKPIINYSKDLNVLFFLLFYFIILGSLFAIINDYVIFLQSLWGLKTFFMYFFVVFIIATYKTPIFWNGFIIRLIKILFLFGTIYVLFAVVQFFGGVNFMKEINFISDSMKTTSTIKGYIRPSSVFRSAFLFANFCLFLFCFSLNFNGKKYKLLSIIFFLGILISTSRSNILAAIIIFIIYLMIKIKLYKLIFLFVINLPFVFTFLALLFYPLSNNILSSNLYYLSSRSLFIRFESWISIIKVWLDNGNIFTVLFGKGFGFLGTGQNILQIFNISSQIENFSVDNLYLFLLVNSGVIGLLIFYTCLVLLLKKNIYILYQGNTQNNNLLKGSLLYLSSIFITGMFSTTLEGFPVQVYIYLIMGLIMITNSKKGHINF